MTEPPLPARIVPYMFMRTRPGEPDRWGLPYVAFLQRWQSRHSPFWEEGRGQHMTPFDFYTVLRCAFAMTPGSDEEQRTIDAGMAVAAALNRAEDERANEQAQAVADCHDLIAGWPGRAAGDERLSLFVAVHGYDTWNHHDNVWHDIRRTPVTFQPIPAADLAVLNDWMTRRYRFPKHPERLTTTLTAAAAGRNRQRGLLAEGLLDAQRNAVRLLAVADRLGLASMA